MKGIKKRKWLLVLLSAVCITVFAAVAAAVGNGRETHKPIRVIYIPKVTGEDSDFWTLLKGGVYMAAEEYGVQLEMIAPEREEEYQKQNDMIQWAVEQNPQAILLSPSTYTKNTDTAKKVKERGIKLVLVDSYLDENIQDSVVATNNRKAGEQIGSYMQRFVKEGSKAVIVGHVQNSSTSREREEGIRKGFDREELLVETVYSNSNYDTAYEKVKEILEKYPEVNIVAGTNEWSMVGAARAVKESGRSEEVKVVGIDSSMEAIQFMEEGVIQCFVIQNPFKMGYMGMEAAVKSVNGENVLKVIDSGSHLITRQDMYTQENQKLLFLFDGE